MNVATMTAAELNTFVVRKGGAAQIDAIIAAQQTEVYKTARVKAERLSLALRQVDGVRQEGAHTSFMRWTVAIESRDEKRLLVVEMDAVVGCIRVSLREAGEHDKDSTLAAGLNYAAIAKCCDAILND